MHRLTRSILLVAAASAALPALAQRYDDGGGRWGRDRGQGRGPMAILFVKDDFQGRSVPIDHEVRKLSSMDMDDKVSSIRIISGAWQVCVDDKFEGRCEIIDRSIGRLTMLNLDDKISSIRPVPPGAMPPGGGWGRR